MVMHARDASFSERASAVSMWPLGLRCAGVCPAVVARLGLALFSSRSFTMFAWRCELHSEVGSGHPETQSENKKERERQGHLTQLFTLHSRQVRPREAKATFSKTHG